MALSGFDWIWEDLVGFGWIWCRFVCGFLSWMLLVMEGFIGIIEGFGWIQLDLAGFNSIQLQLAGFSWIQLDLAGFRRIQKDSDIKFPSICYGMVCMVWYGMYVWYGKYA